MTRIDRFLFVSLLSASAQVAVALTLISLLLEVTSDLDALKLTAHPGAAVLRYYPYRALILGIDLAPFAVFVGLFLSVGRMALRTEITPLILAGLSPRRIASGCLAAGLALAAALALAHHHALPWAARKAASAQFFLHENWQTTEGLPIRHAYFYTPSGDLYYFGELYPEKGIGRNVKCFQFDPRTGRPAASLEAPEAHWSDGGWKAAAGGVIRHFSNQTGMVETPLGPDTQWPPLPFLSHPLDSLIPRHWSLNAMMPQELESWEQRITALGATGRTIRSEGQRRWADSLLPLLVICLALPEALRAERGSYWPRFFKALALLLGFYATQFMSTYLLQDTFPEVGAWLPLCAWLAWVFGLKLR